MRRARVCLGSVLVGLVAIGCSNTSGSGPSFPFSRPEHIAFLCFAPNAADSEDYEVLPRGCCRTFDASSNEDPAALPQYCAQRGAKVLGTPVLHALVTQSSRGEVAAVDLNTERVLDSERAVPGYTFIDSGGLPSAIVAPAYQPRADPGVGPAWTYVASAEENQVRAIASCRFRSGRVCGPELAPLNSDETARIKRTRLSLPAAPHDMVLGPDQALWLTLPDLGLIARIALPASEDNPDAAGDAFVMAAPDQPADPWFYTVPAAPDVQPLEPIAEIDEYLAACGLGYAVQTKRLQLPLAPRTPPTSAVRPTRLRFDESSGILFVADGLAPVLHAFVPQPDGTLNALGALPTGTPVTDFVLTPAVPAHAADLAGASTPEDPNSDTQRYLYAIDDRGLVMVFALSIAQGRPSLQPLLVPTPGTGYADRIELPTPSATLEVIDTRLRSTYVCGEPTDVEGRVARSIDDLNAEKTRLSAEYKGQTAPPILQRVDARVDIYNDAASAQLRGVFVVAASASGLLTVIDVHDLDAPCRARKECCTTAVCTDEVDLTRPRDSGAEDGVAIRRHAVRRSSAGDPDGVVADATKLAPGISTPASYRTFLDVPSLAVAADPWDAINATWNIRYQSILFGGGIAKAVLEPTNSPQIIVRAPAELSLCERGVKEGDLVAITGNAPEYLARSCPDPTEGSEVLLKIDEAYDDHLVTTVQAELTIQDPAQAEARRTELWNRLTSCYPDFAGIELRAGKFVVESADRGIYLHRVIAGPDGRCVDDESKDPLLTSRPVREDATHWSFRNPYVAFTLITPENEADLPTADTSVQVRNASTSLQLSNLSDQLPAALPSEVRYVPDVGELFVLDSAGQELRRYTLAPFQWDRRPFR